jgi:hypothetical protein
VFTLGDTLNKKASDLADTAAVNLKQYMDEYFGQETVRDIDVDEETLDLSF